MSQAAPAPRVLEGLAARPPRPATARMGVTALVVILAAALVYSWIDIHASFSELATGLFSRNGFADIIGHSIPPAGSVLGNSISASVISVSTALLGTFLASIGAAALIPLGARNISPHPALYEAVRLLFALCRAIPTLIWAILFLATVGLGPFSGMLAIWVNCFGVTGKLYCEAVEEMDMAPIDALRIAGDSRAQVFLHAVVPGIAPALTGLWLYRLDSNFRDALTLGVVGAGGIGFLINQSLQLFQYRYVSTEILVMLVWVLIFERISTSARKRLVQNDAIATSGRLNGLRSALWRAGPAGSR